MGEITTGKGATLIRRAMVPMGMGLGKLLG
jgi:hypothetical protein